VGPSDRWSQGGPLPVGTRAEGAHSTHHGYNITGWGSRDRFTSGRSRIAAISSLGLGGAETCKCRVASGLRRFMAPANSLLPRCHSFRPRQAEPQTHNLSVSWDRRQAADRLPAKVAAQCKDRESLLLPSCYVSLSSAGALATARGPAPTGASSKLPQC